MFMVKQQLIFDLRTFVANSTLSRLRAFGGALLAKIWWEGARKHFIRPGLTELIKFAHSVCAFKPKLAHSVCAFKPKLAPSWTKRETKITFSVVMVGLSRQLTVAMADK